mgnify:CR=1 FL=1
MLLLLVIAMIFPSTYPASAAVTWSTSSPDDSYNRPELVSQYDLISVDSAIFDTKLEIIILSQHWPLLMTGPKVSVIFRPSVYAKGRFISDQF